MLTEVDAPNVCSLSRLQLWLSEQCSLRPSIHRCPTSMTSSPGCRTCHAPASWRNWRQVTTASTYGHPLTSTRLYSLGHSMRSRKLGTSTERPTSVACLRGGELWKASTNWAATHPVNVGRVCILGWMHHRPVLRTLPRLCAQWRNRTPTTS